MSYIHPTAIVYPGVRMGLNCYIGPYCIVGLPAEIKEGFDGNPVGMVDIGHNVKLLKNVVIDSGSDGQRTVIGDYCFFMDFVHIGHDCQIGKNVTMAPHTCLAGHVVVGNETNIGMHVAIHQFCEIPGRMMLGQKANVTRKAAAQMNYGETWAGNPARKLGMNKRWITK